jgi:hypothetical protein
MISKPDLVRILQRKTGSQRLMDVKNRVQHLTRGLMKLNKLLRTQNDCPINLKK